RKFSCPSHLALMTRRYPRSRRSQLVHRGGAFMRRFFRNHRGGWAVTALVALALVTGIALGPHLGFTASARSPLWTERTVDVAAAPAAGPNWVELASKLKPAVVNVSTKRTESRPQMRSPFGPGDPFEQFFKDFGDQPRRSVRSMGSGFTING